MTEVISPQTRTKAKQSLMEMAKGWEKVGKVQHAIEAYETVIATDPKSKEAEQARDAIMEIAKKYEREGKSYSAYHIYEKMAEGRIERGKPIS